MKPKSYVEMFQQIEVEVAHIVYTVYNKEIDYLEYDIEHNTYEVSGVVSHGSSCGCCEGDYTYYTIGLDDLERGTDFVIDMLKGIESQKIEDALKRKVVERENAAKELEKEEKRRYETFLRLKNEYEGEEELLNNGT